MKIPLLVCALGLTAARALSAATPPTTFDLIGTWRSHIEFGKAKFTLVVHVTKTSEERVEAKIDIPEQGARGIPVSAMLFNSPDVRWEIDPFNTAFNGKLNDTLDQIDGAFEEGPGGRPIRVVFNRFDESQSKEPPRSYTFAPGEPRDIRGYWGGAVEDQGGKSRIGLKVGRAPDGSFAAALDLLDQGAADLPAAQVTLTGTDAKFDWPGLQLSYAAVLRADASELTGEWKQRGQTSTLTLRRLNAPATVLPPDLSFTPAPGAAGDLRGEWHGTLKVPGQKLRLILRLGQTPEGSLAGSLASPDQGGGEIPITDTGYTNPVVRLEWKGIRGVLTAKLNPEGTLLDGTWQQSGTSFEIQLARATPGPKPANDVPLPPHHNQP